MSGQVQPLSYFRMSVLLSVTAKYADIELVIGARSFNRRSLHHIGNALNPYEQAISIIGKTLAAFDEDNLIPCYGFGDGIFFDIQMVLSGINLI